MANKVVVKLEELRETFGDKKKYRVIALKNTTEFSIKDLLTKAEVDALLQREDPPEINIVPDKRF